MPEGTRSGRSSIALIAELASREAQKADHLEARPAFDKTDAFHKRLEANRARAESERLMDCVPATLVGSPETELVPALEGDGQAPIARLTMIDTLAVPDVISVDASEQRAMGAHRAGVLSAALDTAKSARARNPIEKMLCHQLAALHDAGMDLLIRFRETQSFGNLQIADVVRLTNGAARCFDSYHNGCLALQKLKTGGTQRVLVQHQQLVNVEKGGQAIVARKFNKGSRTPRRRRRNGR
jgi:hypothetical protein